MSVLIEALCVGIATVIVGYIVSFGMIQFLSTTTKHSYRNLLMIIALFITGVLIHLICEYTGVNQWYCKNGVACQ